MTTDQFAELRRRAGLTQEEIGKRLGLTGRTIASWEACDPPRNLSLPEVQAIRWICQPLLLSEPLEEMCRQAYQAVPSELVAIWVCQQGECLLLPSGLRSSEHPEGHSGLIVIAPLTDVSLTTWPLRAGELLNLAGEAITRHPAKRLPGRTTQLAAGGQVESLLHVPAFAPGPQGPRPLLLLSLQNKLNGDGRVHAAGEEMQLYTADDEHRAQSLVREFRERLEADVRLLGMLD